MTDDDQIMISAFRYCLGRQTYIVSDCCRWLRERWPLLSADARAIIREELGHAIQDDARWRVAHHPSGFRSSGHLGSEDIDAPLWRELHTWMGQQGG